MGKRPNRREIRGNQKLLIPDDGGVNLLGGPIFTDLVVKSMGKRGEREKVAEANTHLAKNTMNTRKTHTIQGRLLPNGGHRSDRILARKDRSTCSLKSKSEREEHLGEGLDNLVMQPDLRSLLHQGLQLTPSRHGLQR